jgi:transcriptional regulator with XRE-family HTH domain
MSFASRLKQIMDERDVSQSELALKIGKGKSSVSQYLSGKNIPKMDVQEKIAEVLDCTVEFLNNDENAVVHIDSKNVSVSEAARILGKSEQFVRVALQTGVAPFGFAVKNKSTYSYHISPKKLAEYVGAF